MRSFHDTSVGFVREPLTFGVTIHTTPPVRLANAEEFRVVATSGATYTYRYTALKFRKRNDQLRVTLPRSQEFWTATILSALKQDNVIVDLLFVRSSVKSVKEAEVDYEFEGYLNRIDVRTDSFALDAGIRTGERRPGLFVSADTGFRHLPPNQTRLITTDGVVILGGR